MPVRKRARREKPVADIPEYIRAYFAGEIDEPLISLAYGDEQTMLAYWRSWKREHPKAKPPEALGPWRKLI
jgi:hypothetical protein